MWVVTTQTAQLRKADLGVLGVLGGEIKKLTAKNTKKAKDAKQSLPSKRQSYKFSALSVVKKS